MNPASGSAAAPNPRLRSARQVLVAVLSLLLADRIAWSLGIGRAAGVLCLASLASLVICARLGWRQALPAVAALALLSVPAALSSGDPRLATIVMTLSALALGLSARWQLQLVYWLLMVSLCMLITNNPLPEPLMGSDLARLAIALLASGGLSILLQNRLLPPVPGAVPATPFAVVHSWRRSAAHGLLLASATLVSTPIALQEHWHISGLWLILTPFLVLRPFVQDSWRVALHRSLGSLAGVLVVVALAFLLPPVLPLQLPAIALAVITVLLAGRHRHPALVVTAITATVVLFNSSRADLLLLADERLQANALGVVIALTVMAIAHPIERRLTLRRRSG